MVFIVVMSVACILANMFQCLPVRSNWETSKSLFSCQIYGFVSYISYKAISSRSVNEPFAWVLGHGIFLSFGPLSWKVI